MHGNQRIESHSQKQGDDRQSDGQDAVDDIGELLLNESFVCGQNPVEVDEGEVDHRIKTGNGVDHLELFQLKRGQVYVDGINEKEETEQDRKNDGVNDEVELVDNAEEIVGFCLFAFGDVFGNEACGGGGKAEVDQEQRDDGIGQSIEPVVALSDLGEHPRRVDQTRCDVERNGQIGEECSEFDLFLV